MNPVEGSEADRLRERATENFQRAEQLLKDIAPGRSTGVQYWLLWLRLTHPDSKTRQAAREQIRGQISDSKKAVEFLDVALNFDIPFNEEQTWQYLDQRSKLGGLEGNELLARFRLAERLLSPRDFLSFIGEEEGRLALVLTSGSIALARIEALIRDGQPTKARDLLREKSAQFDDAERQRVEISINAVEGKDPRADLEAHYQATHAQIDLKNLTNHLYQVKDWPALRPLLEELFQQERTLQNALRLVHCMSRIPDTSQADVLSFLSKNQDLVEREPDLKSAKAWALFTSGRPDEAKEICDSLLLMRKEASDLHLEINLALQTGSWEHFPAIVEREWARRDEHSPEILLRLADLAAAVDVTSERAFELVGLAAAKGSDSPHVLTAAIERAYRLGREGEYLREWISRAVALSSGEGPLIAVDFRTMVEEWMPAQREQTRTVEENLIHGSVPLHLAATALNIPLSSLLIGMPRNNLQIQDARRRTVIPILSGARHSVEIRKDWAIGLDSTSIFVLSYLGLLPKAIGSFQRVILAPDTMVLLLNERTQNRFHQPSRVKAAEEIRELIDSGRLQPMESLPSPPEWLVKEVGRDLAQQLQAAQDQQGIVVNPKPIYRLDSLMTDTDKAQLQDYSSLVISTIALEGLLFKRGNVDHDAHERATQYLCSQDSEDGESVHDSILDGPIYLDDLAISYLQSAGILTIVSGCGLDLRVHPSLKQQQNELILRSREGEQLVQEVDKIRTTLRGAIQEGKIDFLPRHPSRDDEHPAARMAPILSQFLQDSGPCDAICIDDRFANRNTALLDHQGKAIPVVCILDVLRYLEANGKLDFTERLVTLHRLRQSGFALVPIDLEELEHRLSSVQWKEDGIFQEGVELRTVRQTLAKLRSLNMLDLPAEAALLSRHRLAVILLIRQLWENEEILIERTVYLSNWLWHHVAPSPLDWQGNNAPNEQAVEALAHHMTLLFQPMLSLGKERLEAFHIWVEGMILKPLLPANAGLADRLAALLGPQIVEWSTRIATDTDDENH
jgi:hypothetical protein